MPDRLTPRLLSERVLAERRRKRARARQRRAAVATAVAIALGVVITVGIGLVDGGNVFKPQDAAGRERRPPVPVARIAPRPHRRTAREASEVQVVDRVLKHMAIVSIAGRRHREIALTFDDGPGPYTLAVVHELRHLHVPATFFQVGSMIPLFPAAERAIARDPDFVIGDHTESHPMMASLSLALQRSQIDSQAAQLYSRRIPYPHLFRPPYGSFNRNTLRLLRARHMLAVLWTIDSQDYARPGAREIADRVLQRAVPGAIALMHDAGGNRSQTVAALPAIVHGLRRRRYHLVTVVRLLHDAPPPRHQPPRSPGSVG